MSDYCRGILLLDVYADMRACSLFLTVLTNKISAAVS